MHLLELNVGMFFKFRRELNDFQLFKEGSPSWHPFGWIDICFDCDETFMNSKGSQGYRLGLRKNQETVGM